MMSTPPGGRDSRLGDAPKVGLDDTGLLTSGSLLLCLSELLDESHGSLFEAALESPAGTGMDELHELLGGKVQQGIEL